MLNSLSTDVMCLVVSMRRINGQCEFSDQRDDGNLSILSREH